MIIIFAEDNSAQQFSPFLKSHQDSA